MIELIKKFQPYNRQEEIDQQRILDFIENNEDCLERSNLDGHLTVSVWVVDSSQTKTLLIYHKVYDSWAWIGGHCDGNANFKEVALKELYEETGVHGKLLDEDIFSLEVLTVDGHMKRGDYVSSHLHYNVTFFVEVDENEILKLNVEETKGVQWFNNVDALKVSNEKWFVENIYKKLLNKVQIYRIKQMESYFDLLLNNNVTKEMYVKLENYYHSDLWKFDFESDEKGILPQNLKRGVLSEDGLYNYFSTNKKGFR